MCRAWFGRRVGLLAALLLSHPTGLLVALVFSLIHVTLALAGDIRQTGCRNALQRGWKQLLLPLAAGSMLLYASRFAADREVCHFEWNIERLLFQPGENSLGHRAYPS